MRRLIQILSVLCFCLTPGCITGAMWNGTISAARAPDDKQPVEEIPPSPRAKVLRGALVTGLVAGTVVATPLTLAVDVVLDPPAAVLFITLLNSGDKSW